MTRFYYHLMTLFVTVISFSGTVSAQSYSDAFLNYKVTAHYTDHTIVAYARPVKKIEVSDGLHYYWFSANQVKITQGGYSGKLLNGGYQDFYLNKNLREAGFFDKGLKKGIWKNWTEEGMLKDQYAFKKGKKNGKYTVYDSVGKVMKQGAYRNDLLNGKQLIFTGDSTRVVYYKAGKVTQKKNLIPPFISRLFKKKPKDKQNTSNPQQPDVTNKKDLQGNPVRSGGQGIPGL